MPLDLPLPFYQPPTDKERLQYLVNLPHRKSGGYCKPLDIGLWDEGKRNQLDMFSQPKKRGG